MERKINVIIDSDVANEVDDKFALTYAFSNRNKLDILAVTIAPFQVNWQRNVSIKDGLLDSKSETLRILRFFGIKPTKEEPYVYLGEDGFLSDNHEKSSPAVEKIILEAKRHKNLHICCLGTLTNVAMAIRKDPTIAKNLKVVWLGTDNVLMKQFEDSNFVKDKKAFYEILASEVNLTIYPTFLGRNFVTSIYEFSNNMKANEVTRYLSKLLKKNELVNECLGLKSIYDIGPVAYLLNKTKFKVDKINASILNKDKVKLDKERKVSYVMRNPHHFFVWKDFFSSVNENQNHILKPQIFFTSDTHFSHEHKIRSKQVPFSSVEEMNEELVKRWNNKVGENDIVYHIGDFGDYEFVKKLNGKIILICGNHEKSTFGRNFKEFREKLLKLGFKEVYQKGLYLDESVLGERVYLTHKPTDHAKDCLTIFGHVHSLSLVKKFGFNVCTSYHYFTPISQSLVKKYVNFIGHNADEEVLC